LQTISREELKKKLDDKELITVVETLQEAAFEKAHIPGAINLPPDRIHELAATRLPDKNAEIIVYCSSPT
jgi:rhodanese-related sulfurtransferase